MSERRRHVGEPREPMIKHGISTIGRAVREGQ